MSALRWSCCRCAVHRSDAAVVRQLLRRRAADLPRRPLLRLRAVDRPCPHRRSYRQSMEGTFNRTTRPPTAATILSTVMGSWRRSSGPRHLWLVESTRMISSSNIPMRQFQCSRNACKRRDTSTSGATGWRVPRKAGNGRSAPEPPTDAKVNGVPRTI